MIRLTAGMTYQNVLSSRFIRIMVEIDCLYKGSRSQLILYKHDDRIFDLAN